MLACFVLNIFITSIIIMINKAKKIEERKILEALFQLLIGRCLSFLLCLPRENIEVIFHENRMKSTFKGTY